MPEHITPIMAAFRRGMPSLFTAEELGEARRGQAAELANVRDVERLNIKPGEALAIHMRTQITREQAANIRAAFAAALPGVQTVIVPHDADLKVISAELADQLDPTERPTPSPHS